MTKITEVLKLIAPVLHEYVSLTRAIEVAEAIESLYIFDAEAWVRDHKDEYEGRRIAAIRDLRNVSAEFSTDHRPMGLKECKDIVDRVMPYPVVPQRPVADDDFLARTDAAIARNDEAINRLREKLTAHPVDDYTSATDSYDDEDRAFAESRERMAESGTWFGTPGPLDEEPF